MQTFQPDPRRLRRLGRAAAGACLAMAVASGADARPSITGVCPDGSMFVVKREADVPCPDARQVEPHDLPPIRPNYLPRPYGWQVFQNKQDPNNPYNLVGQAQTIRDAGQPLEDDASAPAPDARATGQQHAALPPVAAAPAHPTPLALSDDERRDLALIVELSQQRAAARFGGDGEALEVQLAYSRSFESRLHEHYAGETLGHVVLFSVAANQAASFHPNFTFVQGHAAFHPGRNDPRQLGLLSGDFGPLAAGDRVLGYAVLPPETDLSAPLDVYWDDRLITVAFTP